ncbi:DNA methylase [Mycobacteroides sp. H001]|uniref:DNA-methyltransferase n=1 Tax=unclassified Mycobacteroides TaxID=2618759 RepID=UPI00071357F1|nr:MULTISPECIES: site-specific DNA-methyltransferase [unclassified Mycobacteroides]KRQ29776.1 DNA methylase [Mycobacteroides sp. H002]KRQ29893.1 DNA methylase [Mycobacteroides sp. H072]KRQ48353.1 DNA methylase [Mycobacteroides sp. H054]KRQ65146.1 DNA methylase [Mycobacteroides sp. H001]
MTAPYYQDDSVTLHHGDCLDVLRELADNRVDAVITDPPYSLNFMGREWDSHRSSDEFQSWCTAWATECLRILKPGGHLLAFGGSRTWHRLSSGIEDAGFEIRDSIAWLYGSGFPKSMDVPKAIDKAAGAQREVVGRKEGRAAQPRTDMRGGNYGSGTSKPAAIDLSAVTAPATEAAKRWQGWGTALKPSFEPIVVARKPLSGTVVANVLEHGTGALNIDACRVGTDKRTNPAGSQSSLQRVSRVEQGYRDNLTSSVGESSIMSGRWPTNVVLDEHQAEVLDRQSGVSSSRVGRPRGAASGAGWGMTATGAEYDDAGGASRFFPVFRYEAKAPTSERPSADGVQHPTVKPLDLMRWLVRLVTPIGAVVLEPFAGSGTTAEACVLEDRRCIAIEREADYLPLIVSRLRKPLQQGLFGLEAGA